MTQVSDYIKCTSLPLDTSFDFLYLFLIRTLPGDQTSVFGTSKTYTEIGRTIKFVRFNGMRNIYEGSDVEVFLTSSMNRYGQEHVSINIFEISDETKIHYSYNVIFEYIYERLGIPKVVDNDITDDTTTLEQNI